jgi:hypothetical protein
MRDWAAVPGSLLAHTAELRKYFDPGLPRAARKKSKAGAAHKGKG